MEGQNSWHRSSSMIKIGIGILIVLLTLLLPAFFVHRTFRSKDKVSIAIPSASTYRLPTDVLPIHYYLFIDASQLEQSLYHGQVDIDVRILQPVHRIQLNAVTVNITEIKFFYNYIQEWSYRSIEYDLKHELITIHFTQLIKPGTGRLHFIFHGRINDQLHGFYRTKDGPRIGACTQFEAAYARRTFPCFDEPSFKANFSITIRSPQNLTTLSNMPVRSEYMHNDGTCTYEFDPTPIMSTYLVAFVIGAYDYVETRDMNQVLIRVYTPAGKKEQGLFALKTAAQILPFYAQYFGIKYPLSKLDMIAIADFSSGAMENWGLITYRETYLLVDSQTSTQKTKQEVALVVAHELAHQWFGNLVTMQWWNDLWLNEDKSRSIRIFASWIEFLAVDYVYPEYDIWTQFVADTLSTCMIPDALQTSHPIEVPIEKPSDIDEIFDDITYDKGSSVIRWLHAFIGPDAFRRGLSNYLAEYAYKNTNTENLWYQLSRASNRSDLVDVISTWTKQIGFPLLTVKETKHANHRLLTIEQTRFLADGTRNDSVRWRIPIDISTKSFPKTSVYQLFLNGSKEQEFLLENLSSTEWIKLNLFSVGIYRVHYPPSMLEAMSPALLDRTLSPQDRFNIQTDVYALARAGHLAYVEYLKLLRNAYRYEENLTVWKSILRHLSELGSIFEYAYLPDTKFLYYRYFCNLLSNIYEKLGWDALPNENPQAPMLRSLILTHLGIHGDRRISQEAQRRFQRFILYPSEQHLINPNIRTAIYLTVAKSGDEETFQQLKMLYSRAETQEERVRLLTALCRFDNESLQHRALALIWNSSEVRKQDHLTGFASLAGHNRYGCELAWKYMQEHWKAIEEIYGSHDSHLIHFIESVPSLFISEERAEEVRAFYRRHPNPFLYRSVKKVLEHIHIRRLVLQRHETEINRFLRQFQSQ